MLLVFLSVICLYINDGVCILRMRTFRHAHVFLLSSRFTVHANVFRICIFSFIYHDFSYNNLQGLNTSKFKKWASMFVWRGKCYYTNLLIWWILYTNIIYRSNEIVFIKYFSLSELRTLAYSGIEYHVNQYFAD